MRTLLRQSAATFHRPVAMGPIPSGGSAYTQASRISNRSTPYPYLFAGIRPPS